MTPTKKSRKPIKQSLSKSFKIYNVYVDKEIKELAGGIRSVITWTAGNKLIFLDWQRLVYGIIPKQKFLNLNPKKVDQPHMQYILDQIKKKAFKIERQNNPIIVKFINRIYNLRTDLQ